jgi:hypothetical protein
MEDIIDIIVTETTNTIEITAQPNDEIIDVNIIDNREDIVLNVTPTVVEININSLTSNFGVEWGDITGTLADQTDLNNALALKANLVGGKVPASELPSYVDDVVEVANFAALPATGETGKIYITLDNNKIYRWSGSVYVEIADSTAVWGAITGTLSSQTDLQNALNAKFDDPTGDTTQYIAGDGSLIAFPVAGQAGTLVREVRNTTGATLTKGTIVYISGATGNKPTVSKALATGDSTSAQTFGMCQANIANNSNGYVVCVGDLGGLDTSGLTEGAQLYLSSTTAGTYTTTKQLAPNHLVYIGVVTRAHPTLGQIEVKIQNGYELNEIHDVAISSLANNDGLFYESATDLWKNKSIATVLGYTPANGANYLPLTGGTLSGQLNIDSALRIKSGSVTGILLETYSTNELRIRVTPVSTTFDMNLVFPSASRTFTFPNATGTLALSSDLNAYQPLLTNPVTGTGTSGIVAKFNGTSTITDSIIYDNGTRVSIGANVTTSNTFTAVASTTSAYAVVAQASGAANGFWAVLSGTGEIFRGQTNGGSYFIVNNGGNAFLNGNLNIGDFGSTSFKLNVIGTGNFTGALSGTSASFTGNVSITANSARLTVSESGGAEIRVTAGGSSGFIGTYSNHSLTFLTNSATALTLASSGAATFASSITSAQGITAQGGLDVYASTGSTKFLITSAGAGHALGLLYDSANVSKIQLYTAGNSYFNGGNVGIGTTAPNSGLHISSGATRGLRIDVDSGVAGFSMSPNGIFGIDEPGVGNGRFVINTNGRVGIGQTAPGVALSVAGQSEAWQFGVTTVTGTAGALIGSPSANVLAFGDWSGAERMRIDSSGQTFTISEGTAFSAGVTAGAGTSTAIYVGRYGGTAGSFNSGTVSYVVWSNGNVVNTNNSYGAYSDIKLKENITDATSKLTDLLKVKIKNYNLIGDNKKQLGVIAQELEEIFPNMVEEIKDYNSNETIKSVKYSVFVPMLIKAVQEQQAQIEELKNK